MQVSLVPNQLGLLARLPWSRSDWETQGRGLSNILRPQRSLGLQKTLYVTLITVPGTAASRSYLASCTDSGHAVHRAVLAPISSSVQQPVAAHLHCLVVTAPPETALFSAGYALQETARPI